MIAAAKRSLRAAAGWCLLLAGVVLIPLPGPGLPVILGGLTLLSRDSGWARRLTDKLAGYLRRLRAREDGCASSSPLSSPP